MDLEFLFLLENIATIIIGLLILVIGFRTRDHFYSEEARQRLMDNWRKYTIGIFLFGASLFLYLIAEFSQFADPYSNFDLKFVHEWGEIIHMSLLIFAMALSLVVAIGMGSGKR